MEDLILIDGGEVFEGSWAQLADCFGIMDEHNLCGFCEVHDCVFEIKQPTVH